MKTRKNCNAVILTAVAAASSRCFSPDTTQYCLIIAVFGGQDARRTAVKMTALQFSNCFLRSGTSPGAHYREACRAKSTPDFISKIEGALQELEESDYWLELLIDGGFTAKNKLQPLCEETGELIAIFVTMVLKAKAKNQKLKNEIFIPHPLSFILHFPDRFRQRTENLPSVV